MKTIGLCVAVLIGVLMLLTLLRIKRAHRPRPLPGAPTARADAEDVVDHTPPGAKNIQIVHLRSPNALNRVLQASPPPGYTVVDRIVITRVANDPTVSRQSPMIVNVFAPNQQP